MASSEEVPKAKRRNLDWILWWRIDPLELKDQVTRYETFKFYQSARGFAFLLLLFSAALTCLFAIGHVIPQEGYLDAALMVGVGFFVWRGHRWAMVVAMVLWTAEKVLQLVPTEPGEHLPNAVVLLIWWAAYMHAFWLALRVEVKRRADQTITAATSGRLPP